MPPRTVPAGTFKAQCLRMLDEVAEHGTTIVVTKHGRPVARIVPLDDRPAITGSVTVLTDDEEALFSTGEDWDAEA